MSVGSREAKVFAALVILMAVGIVILQALVNNPPSAGAFCLSRYTQTVPVEEAVLSRAGQADVPWDSIESSPEQSKLLCGYCRIKYQKKATLYADKKCPCPCEVIRT